jgi:hypothetical protein
MTYNDFYREKRGNIKRSLTNYLHLTSIQTSFAITKQGFILGAEFGQSQKSFRYDLYENKSVNLKSSFKEYRFFVSTSMLKDYFLLRGGLGKKVINGDEFKTWNFGVTFKPVNSFAFTYNRYEDIFRWEYNFSIDGTTESLIADEFSQFDEYKIRLDLIPEVIISAAMQNNYINKNRKINDAGTILVPTGAHYQRNINLNLFPQKMFGVNFYYYKRNHDLIGYFYNRYQIFGKLTVHNDHSERYQSQLVYRADRQIFGLHFGLAKGMMNSNGHVESWPFTSTIVDLLGLRYNFRSNMTYKLFHFGTSYHYSGKHWGILFKGSFERIRPGMEAKTWEPEMLVFGVNNLNIYSIDKKYWDGAYIGLRITKSINTLLQFVYEFNQYIPIEFNSVNSGKNTHITPEDKKNIYGGGKHTVYIILTL